AAVSTRVPQSDRAGPSQFGNRPGSRNLSGVGEVVGAVEGDRAVVCNIATESSGRGCIADLQGGTRIHCGSPAQGSGDDKRTRADCAAAGIAVVAGQGQRESAGFGQAVTIAAVSNASNKGNRTIEGQSA